MKREEERKKKVVPDQESRLALVEPFIYNMQRQLSTAAINLLIWYACHDSHTSSRELKTDRRTVITTNHVNYGVVGCWGTPHCLDVKCNLKSSKTGDLEMLIIREDSWESYKNPSLSFPPFIKLSNKRKCT